MGLLNNIAISTSDDLSKDKEKYFLPHLCWNGLQLFLKNVPDCVRWLLEQHPGKYVQLYRFKNFQNKLESRFAAQRAYKHNTPNPTCYDYRFIDAALDIIGLKKLHYHYQKEEN